jgi:hypothetical protein
LGGVELDCGDGGAIEKEVDAEINCDERARHGSYIRANGTVAGCASEEMMPCSFCHCLASTSILPNQIRRPAP